MTDGQASEAKTGTSPAGDPCACTPPAAAGTKPLGVRLFWV